MKRISQGFLMGKKLVYVGRLSEKSKNGNFKDFACNKINNLKVSDLRN